MSLNERIATADGKRRYVRTLFATIADRYDLITKVLSYGQDRRWKRRLVDLGRPASGMLALDLATGTGDIAFLLHDRAARTIGLDVTLRMIELARAKRPDSSAPQFIVGDMTALPFPSASVDMVTTGYGLRNVPDLAMSLDFNRPSAAWLRTIYLLYLAVVGGMLGWVLHRDPDTYRYIPASIRTYPGGEGVAALMRARGFSSVRHYPVLGGLMSIHHALK